MDKVQKPFLTFWTKFLFFVWIECFFLLIVILSLGFFKNIVWNLAMLFVVAL
jgi:hypothetical protein